ncbi:uncharacterized protein LOC117640230 [Thrips palmi]|uniref:Uncharacterized protein LOC117640230 n=1 Tax=Thrips palmi TaxID=161013 RepID=A0A6P8ZHU3_THRPL|nr:uncharacterized protein LOC117640230 [Thrips palmi]
MERFTSVPGSPMTDTPICDSDEEVFFGPVTTKELNKASQLKRRTQFYFPTFNWKPSTPLNNAANSIDDKESGTKTTSSDTTDRANLSLSADSLETESFVTISDRPEDSSKGEFCSALSGNTSNSQPSLNEANFYSKFSEDSLESDKPVGLDNTAPESIPRMNSHTPRKASSFFSNMSEDSLENTEHAMNVARLHSGLSGNTWNNSEDLSQEAQTSNENIESKNVSNLNETQSGSESGFNNDSLLSTPKVGANGQLLKPGCIESKSNKALTSTYEVLPEIEDNETYTIDDDSCEVIEPAASTNINLSDEVPVDKDGGFLSILSEAALYHASQLKENENVPFHGAEDSTSTTQSLEDRFKMFGIGANDLEDQQLSNSIMYTTGRESNVLSSETESNTYYTGLNSGPGSSFSSEEHYNKQSVENLGNCGASYSQYEEESTECRESSVVNVTSGSESTSSKMQYSNVLNQPISNGTLGSAGSTFESSNHENSSSNEVHPCSENEGEAMEHTDSYDNESSEISGVCRLNSVSENQSNSSIQSCHDEDVLTNDSDVSSYAGELNDTLEEYEMMMRYGVEYILGRRGNKKGKNAEKDEENPTVSPSPLEQNVSPLHKAPLMPKTVSSPHTHQQNSSASSSEYHDAVDVSPRLKQTSSCRTNDHKGISPLHKQLFKHTPQKNVKNMQGVSTKGSSNKLPSKLPRVASMTPTKLVPMTSPQTPKQFVRPMTSSSESKITSKYQRPVTPSSEPKIGFFKKPVAPVAGGSRIPKNFTSKPNNKVLENIQSPVGAYIHNSPSPVLVTNIKGKCSDRSGFEKEMHARALWRAGEVKSSIPKPTSSQVSNMENINPNIGCGLPPVKYTKAPCVKLDEATKLPVPKGGEKISKLMDAPAPQVIKHEGRVRVNCGSPQLAARMHSMADTFDDSLIDVHSVSGDISVCVSQDACRTNTLGHH